MKKQNYSNHTRFVPIYHFGIFFLLFVLLAGSVYYLFVNDESSQIFPILFLILNVNLILITFFSRLFALRAQDRAIRAEENLRYFILTGKRMSQSVSIRQIIALRFAGDEEFVPLIEKTINENLTPKQIKKEIKDWRGDYYRV